MKLVKIKSQVFVNPDHVVSVMGTATHVAIELSTGKIIIHDVSTDHAHLLAETLENLRAEGTLKLHADD